MILDSNAKLCDGDPNTAANLKTINTGFSFAGREDILLYFNVTEAFVAGTSMVFKLQESDTKTGTFTDVADSEFTLLTAKLVVGAGAPYRYLPKNLKKVWIKFAATAEGTFTAGKIVSGLVTQKNMPYTNGLYIDKGVVVQ